MANYEYGYVTAARKIAGTLADRDIAAGERQRARHDAGRLHNSLNGVLLTIIRSGGSTLGYETAAFIIDNAMDNACEEDNGTR